MATSSSPRTWTRDGLFALFLALGAGACSAQSAARVAELKDCLQQFDGIAWKLPYQPPLRVHSCEAKTTAHRKLELIGELTLGNIRGEYTVDEGYAALQQAVFIHFDALFKQGGYYLQGTEQGNARVEYSAYTQCMLRGGHCVEDPPQAPKPPIPYVSVARYVRQSGAHTITLTYTAAAKNLWSISLDGMPAAGAR